MESDGDEGEKKMQCFVCYESENVKNFKTDSMEEIPLKIPDSVMDRLKTRLRQDIVKSLKNPDASFFNVFCKTCLKMTNEIFHLCCKLDELKAEIDRKTNDYTNRIISCRQDPENEEAPSLIRVSQSCFENDDDDGNDDSFFPGTTDDFESSNENDEIVAEDVKFSIPGKTLSVSPIVSSKHNTRSSKINQSMSSTSTAKKLDKISTRKKSGVQKNDTDLSHLGLKKLVISLERISTSKLKCNICSKYFASNGALEKHKPTHILMLEPKCPKCKRYLIAQKPPSNIPVKPRQSYMSCGACKKGFVFQKKMCKIYKSTPLPSTPLIKPRRNPPTENSRDKSQTDKTIPEGTSISTEKQELKTYQSKKGPVVQDFCSICKIPVLQSMLEHHMKHYHPNKSVESEDAEVEVVAIKVDHKLIVKKPKPTGPENPKDTLKSNLKCMACSNHLIFDVPPSHKQQLQSMVDKFPGRKLLYCSYCKQVLVVGEKSSNSLSFPKGLYEKRLLEDLKEKNTFKCHECSGSFATQYMKIVHRHWNCKSVKRSCDICKKSFKFSYDLHSHVTDHHSDMDKSLWNICSKCGDSYADAAVHELICLGTLGRSCSQCAQVCPSDELLLKHIENSHGQPRLVRFITKPSEDHKKKDEQKRPLHKPRRLCENCGKTFINYRFHVKTCGKHTGKFECTKCLNKDGKSVTFESQRKLKMHTKLYHVLVHKCDLCARGFAKRGDLKRHQLMSHSIKIK